MGIMNRLKKRVKGGLKLAQTIASTVSEEARHPGRPPSSMAANSPFWKDDGNDPAHQKAKAGIAEAKAEASAAPLPDPSATKGLPKPVDTSGRDDEPFWFLKDGGDDGWDTTNPSEEWRERHGDENPEDYGKGG
jgi:hypothetical protein